MKIHVIYFGIKNKGYIKENYDADLTIVDMKKDVVIKDSWIESKCGWTPFNNYKVKDFLLQQLLMVKLLWKIIKLYHLPKGSL